MNKALFMETTKIDSDKTVSEIQAVLGKYGASAVLTEWDNGEISAVSFKIKVEDAEIPFRLPCRWKPIHKYLLNKRDCPKMGRSEKQAKRIAWRQILRWIEAQMALVETDMVKIQEVFLPYMQTGIGKTLYEQLEEKGFKQLGPANEE